MPGTTLSDNVVLLEQGLTFRDVSMQKAGLIFSTAWPNMVYLRLVSNSQLKQTWQTHRKAEKKTGEMMSLLSATCLVDRSGLTKRSAS